MEPIRKLCTDHALWVKELQEFEHSDVRTHSHWWEKQLMQQLALPNSEFFKEIKVLLIRIRSTKLKEQLQKVEAEAKSVLQALEENPVETQ
jgi:hypothetical protein